MLDIFDAIEGKVKKKETKEELNEEDEQEEDEQEEDVEDKNEEIKKDDKKIGYDEIPLEFLEHDDIPDHSFVGRKKSVLKKYGEEASLFLGKVYEPNYPEKKIYYDSLDPQVMFVCGARGSGKSYSLGVVAEELALKNKNVGMVVIDPVGVFWSMKYPNRDKREVEMLTEYNLEPQGLENIFVFIPEGAKHATPKETYDSTFTLQPSFLTAEDWSITFGFERFSPPGLILEKAIKKVEEGYRTLEGLIFNGKRKNYDINDIIYCLENDSELNSKERGFKKDSIRAIVSRFEAAKTWGIFSKTGTPLIEISVPGQLTIIDVSFLEENVAALLVGILARRILSARKINTRKHAAQKMSNEKKEEDLEYDIPPTWLFLDEAHTLIPGGGIVTPASKALIEYVKQGRQPGCSLVFATQQPSAIDTRVLSQVGTLLTYKLVFDDDIKSVFKRMPTMVPKIFKDPSYIKTLEIGIPIIADRVETTTRAFKAKIRPRMSQHEGRETQTAEINKDFSQDEILDLMVSIAKTKIQNFDELDESGIRTLLKILNMKYKPKSDISYDVFSNELIKQGVTLDNGKYFLDKNDEPESYFEKITYKVILAKLDEEDALISLNNNVDFEVQKVYRPIMKVNYKHFNTDGSFVNDVCFIDPIKVEFIHFIDNEFLYSEGLNYLRMFEADDIHLLMKLPRTKGFDIDWLKDNSSFGDVKLKRIMERFIQLGLARKEKRGTRNVYYMLKHLEIPKKPLLKPLSSLNNISLQDKEVEKEAILEPLVTLESIRNMLGTLWPSIKIDDIETYLKEEYMATNNNSKESIMIDGYTGKRI